MFELNLLTEEEIRKERIIPDNLNYNLAYLNDFAIVLGQQLLLGNMIIH